MAKKSRSVNTLLNTMAGITAKSINIITGLIMRTVFIRTLGIEYAGISTLFTDILTALSFAELGISGAITFALYKPLAENDDRRVAALMNFYKRAYQIVAAVVLVAGLAVAPFLSVIVKDVPNIKEDITLIYILYVINSAVSYLLVYKSTLLTAKQEQRYVSLIQIGISVARVIIESVILIVFRKFLLYLIVGILLTRLQNALISRFASKRYSQLKELGDEKLPKEERRKLMGDVRALMLYKISNSLINGCDSVVISSFLGAGWVALVGNYTMVTYRVQNLINQFYNAANPSIGNLAAATNEERQYKTFQVLQFMSFWISCFCSTSFLVLLNP
ncbi:MAG: oligosaccharide flippase family protein, partial [Clostridia bacterium]|nr:oligosaccharide flippase family protein [Clostridia bacterium]